MLYGKKLKKFYKSSLVCISLWLFFVLLTGCNPLSNNTDFEFELIEKENEWIMFGTATASTNGQEFFSGKGTTITHSITGSISLDLEEIIPLLSAKVEYQYSTSSIDIIGTTVIINKGQKVDFYFQDKTHTYKINELEYKNNDAPPEIKGTGEIEIVIGRLYAWVIYDEDGNILEDIRKDLPATQPPATQPPTTQPPATQPPTTQPPTTQPPVAIAIWSEWSEGLPDSIKNNSTYIIESKKQYRYCYSQEIVNNVGEWREGAPGPMSDTVEQQFRTPLIPFLWGEWINDFDRQPYGGDGREYRYRAIGEWIPNAPPPNTGEVETQYCSTKGEWIDYITGDPFPEDNLGWQYRTIGDWEFSWPATNGSVQVQYRELIYGEWQNYAEGDPFPSSDIITWRYREFSVSTELSNWSQWSDKSVVEEKNKIIEIRTLYRYKVK